MGRIRKVKGGFKVRGSSRVDDENVVLVFIHGVADSRDGLCKNSGWRSETRKHDNRAGQNPMGNDLLPVALLFVLQGFCRQDPPLRVRLVDVPVKVDHRRGA